MASSCSDRTQKKDWFSARLPNFSLSISLDLKTEMLSQVRKRPNVEWWNSPVKPATLAVDGEGAGTTSKGAGNSIVPESSLVL
jgi:hypothetical protein